MTVKIYQYSVIIFIQLVIFLTRFDRLKRNASSLVNSVTQKFDTSKISRINNKKIFNMSALEVKFVVEKISKIKQESCLKMAA